MSKKRDVIIIGAGILGISHAYSCLKRGLSVTLIEKDSQPSSATVRNFGQIVPSGMNAKWQELGRISLEVYKEIQSETDISVREQGSVYIASDEEEMALLEELCNLNKENQYPSQLLHKNECLLKYQGLRSEYVKGGLYFPEEINVDPRKLAINLIGYLKEKYDLKYVPNTAIIHLEELNGEVHALSSFGKVFRGANCFVTSGSEFQLLYPEVFAESNIDVVKLQMIEIAAQQHLKIPGSILTGWTIRRYESFGECPSYAEIKSREDKSAFHNQWGVHILFKQSPDGTIILGDTHEYAQIKDRVHLGFDLRGDMNQFLLEEAKKIFNLETWAVNRSWYGIYSQCKGKDIFQQTIGANIHIVTAIGGKGMTGSLGFAQNHIASIYT